MVLNFPPQRIICLTEETVETLYLLGEEKRIVGVTGYAIRPKRVRLEKQRVGSFISVNIEKIKKLKPELILTFSDVQANLTKQLILEGFNVICFNQKSISEIFSMIKYLGSLVGNIEGARDLVTKLENQINLIKKKNTKLKPKVYFEEWDDPYISAIGWVSEIIEIAGGVDIFAERSKAHKSKVRSVSSNEVICKNPDIILVPLLAFDSKKVRLGYGKGFYDRYLKKNKKILTVGIAFSFQRHHKLPTNNNDIKLDYILTEKGII